MTGENKPQPAVAGWPTSPKHAAPPARRPRAPTMPQPRRLVRRVMRGAQVRGLPRKQSSWVVLQVAQHVRDDLDAMFYDHGAAPSDLLRWLDYLVREATVEHDQSKP